MVSVTSGRAFGKKQSQIKHKNKFHTGSVGVKLTMSTTCGVDQQATSGNWPTVMLLNCSRRQREKGEAERVGVKVGTLNVGMVTGKDRDLTDMMQRRKVDVWCV